MELKEYVKLACVTESVVKDIDGLNSRVLHGLIGLCTESAELLDAQKKHLFYGKKLDTVNMLEEIGDLCWYLAILCDVMGVDFAESVKNAKTHNDSSSRNILFISSELNAVCAGNLLTMVTTGNPHTISPLFYLIDEMIIELDGTWEEICEKNIAKLKARYGEKFDAHKALHRDTDKERKILES